MFGASSFGVPVSRPPAFGPVACMVRKSEACKFGSEDSRAGEIHMKVLRLD